MKAVLIFTAMFFSAMNISAQKQNFDLISFSAPKGWQQQQNEGGVQLSVTDKKTGAYALIIITKATASSANASENFKSDWEKLIKGSVQVNAEPAMQEPAKENGWEILSGRANYTDGPQKGWATLLTATGGGQMASVVLMTNTDYYQNELLAFLNSLEMAAIQQNKINDSKPPVTGNANSLSIVGLWTDYLIETAGYISGMPQYTAGYFRKEYIFYGDGAYLFKVKNWSATSKEILFVYETGVYTISGNKITIHPKQGRGEWWSKAAGGSTKGWGNKVKTATWELETVTYNFDLHYFSGTNETYLVLQAGKQTEREGRQENNKSSFKPKALNQSLIDNPPGFKTGFENKQLTASVTSSSTTNAPAINAALAGRIWEGTSYEKLLDNSNTGGYFTWQYQFNANGTYRFVYVGASAYTQPNLLQYETGNWSVNGNQLTIVPKSGANEEWSVVGGPISIAGMSDTHIREIKNSWGKKIKSANRKLEKYTYSFSIEFMKGNDANALLLEYNSPTVREGNGNKTYYFETSTVKSIKLPTEMQ